MAKITFKNNEQEIKSLETENDNSYLENQIALKELLKSGVLYLIVFAGLIIAFYYFNKLYLARF